MSNLIKIFVRARHWQIALVLIVIFFLQKPYFLLTYHMVVALMGLIIYTWFYSICKLSTDLYKPYEKYSRIFLFSWVICLGYLAYLSFFGIYPPAHIAAVVATFFNMIMAAKGLSNVEYKENRKVNFWTALFSLWFFPVGIWYIQPIVNKLESPQFK